MIDDEIDTTGVV